MTSFGKSGQSLERGSFPIVVESALQRMNLQREGAKAKAYQRIFHSRALAIGLNQRFVIVCAKRSTSKREAILGLVNPANAGPGTLP